MADEKRLGLDIGSYAVKMVEVSGSGESLELGAFGMKKITSSSKVGITQAIKDLMRESGVSAKEANISVSGPSVIVRFVSMPKMKDEELKSAARFEAERVMPFNINECIVDFDILKSDNKDARPAHETPGGAGKTAIILVAAKKDYIEDRIKMAEACGLSLGIVDVDGLALGNAFSQTPAPAFAPGKNAALLNIGARLTNLSIVRDRAVCFTRDLAIGGNDFNAAISKALGVDEARADDMKISPQDRRKEVIDSTKGAAVGLLDEVKLSFNYYENQSGRGVDEIYVSGGGASLVGLEDLFQENFGARPSFWNPVQFLKTGSAGIDLKTLDKVKYFLGVAAGLAIR